METAKNYVEIGAKKAETKLPRLFVLAILAGMFIAFAGVCSGIISCKIENPSIAKICAAGIFPLGLAMVVIAGSELLTGDCLMVISVLEKRLSFAKLLKTWGIVFVGNFVGAVLVAVLCAYGHVYSAFGEDFAKSVVATAEYKSALSFGDAFIKGILCNILVCIAVWMGMSAKSVGSKIAVLYLPVFAFVACGFEHSIANMYYIPAGMFAQNIYNIASEGLGAYSFLIGNILPVTLGNIVGGAAVGAAYWFVYLKKVK